jgi:hypothetical protein
VCIPLYFGDCVSLAIEGVLDKVSVLVATPPLTTDCLLFPSVPPGEAAALLAMEGDFVDGLPIDFDMDFRDLITSGVKVQASSSLD